MKKTFIFVSVLAAAILSFACLAASAQDYRVLHHFTGGANDGASPYGSVVQSGSTLYGMTRLGGANNLGTIFRMNVDGSGFSVMHSFVSGADDGSTPYGSLLLSGSCLYGMAGSAGAAYQGTLFRINTNGTDFQVLHRFSGNEGKWPYGDLIESGSLLYGITTYGGNNTNSGYVGAGTIFQINKDGTGFQLLHTFGGAPGDGSNPYCPVIQSGSVLYGSGNRGGASDLGAVFKMNANGTGFQLLRSFHGGSDGAYPCFGELAQSGTTLYGTTVWGGSGSGGTIFRLNTNGTGFQVLRHFSGGINDGSGPTGGLLQSGSMLYGMTSDGGVSGNGVVYQIKTNGTAFQVLHRFGGGTSDGQNPPGDLILVGTTLYGMTIAGGSNNAGVIFALDLPQPSLAISLSDTNVNLSWSTNCPDYTLESAGQLAGTWTPVPGVTGYSATLPVSAGTNQFFRLGK